MANEKVLGVISGTYQGKPLVVTTPTRCDAPVSGEVYLGLASGSYNGKPLLAISTQRCDGDTSNLANGQTYLGLASGTYLGKPLLVVPCGPCDTTPPCEDCNECGWTHAGAPASFTLTVHSPSGGFDDFTVTLTKVSPTGSAVGTYGGHDLGASDAIYRTADCDPPWDGDGGDDTYYAHLVYRGTVSTEWDLPGVSVSGQPCDSNPFVSLTDQTIKLLAYAQLVNLVYREGETYCYSWLLAVNAIDYRDAATIKVYLLTGNTIPGVDCDVDETVIPANMTVNCDNDPAYFSASGTIVCADENTDCDGVVGMGVTNWETVEGDTFTLTVT